MWMQDEYEGYEGKYWSLPPRKILPKPYVKPHPPMWYAAGNTSQLRDGGAQGPRRARLLGRQHRRAWSRCSRRTRTTIGERRADRRVRQRQRDGHRRARSCAEDRERGGRSRWSNGRLALPAEQRVPLPRHLPAPRRASRRGPSSSPTRPSTRSSSARSASRAWSSATRTRRCRRARSWADAGADQLVLRAAAWPPQEDSARDDPAHRRARHPARSTRTPSTARAASGARQARRSEPVPTDRRTTGTVMSNPFSYENKRVVVTGGADRRRRRPPRGARRAGRRARDRPRRQGADRPAHDVPRRATSSDQVRGRRCDRRHRRTGRRAVQQRRRRRHPAARAP